MTYSATALGGVRLTAPARAASVLPAYVVWSSIEVVLDTLLTI